MSEYCVAKMRFSLWRLKRYCGNRILIDIIRSKDEILPLEIETVEKVWKMLMILHVAKMRFSLWRLKHDWFQLGQRKGICSKDEILPLEIETT